MIGMILITHGRLAEEMRAAMEHVVGPQRNVASICVGPDDDLETRRNDIKKCIEMVDTGDGVIMFTDMFGGTPSNLAISLVTQYDIEVIAGMNLPMLVKFAKIRGTNTLAECVNQTEQAGRKYIATSSNCVCPRKTNQQQKTF
jgi:mannose PTS system EIIA component